MYGSYFLNPGIPASQQEPHIPTIPCVIPSAAPIDPVMPTIQLITPEIVPKTQTAEKPPEISITAKPITDFVQTEPIPTKIPKPTEANIGEIKSAGFKFNMSTLYGLLLIGVIIFLFCLWKIFYNSATQEDLDLHLSRHDDIDIALDDDIQIEINNKDENIINDSEGESKV